jgi:Zn finger protein HypA/HybF involved in hydrogenase expression
LRIGKGSGMTDAEWEWYVEAMRKPCVRCNEYFEGASWLGRCRECHDLIALPYESGEDYIGIGV